MRLMSRAALALAAIFTLAPALHAQTSFSVAAGASLPMGDFADAYKMGYNVTAGLGIKPPLAPVGVRIEGMYNSYEGDGFDGNFSILAGTVNATLSAAALPMGYLIGGLGMYRSTQDITSIGSQSMTDVGFNIGAGLKFPLTGFSPFAEIRLHLVNTEGGSTKFVPVVFGLTF